MCDRPLKGFQIGYTRLGKPNYLICSPDIDYIYTTDKIDPKKDLNNGYKWVKAHGFVPKSLNAYVVSKYTLIPCGSCISCRVNRAGELADRCMLEMKYHDQSCYVTLTYSDDFIIRYNYIRKDTGEYGTASTLFKKHYMDFFKRLRKANPDLDIRYVLCGEYGDTTDRPHYHAIIFGYKPSDLRIIGHNKYGQFLYMSEELNNIWKLGNCIIGEVTKDSANYVARYVTKKLYADLGKEKYQNIGRIPPFITTSKRPAIGKRWYEDNKDWCFDHQISYSTDKGGRSFNAPRYFKKLRDKEGLGKYTDIEDLKNDVNCSQFDHLKDINNQTYEEQADAKVRISEARNKAYLRDKI